MAKSNRASVGATTKRANAETVEAFASLANSLSASDPSGAHVRLNNITFWCGAGFAKAWEPKSPTGTELFNLDPEDLTDKTVLDAFERILGVDTLDGLSEEDLRKINYFLDMNEKYPDIRGRYIDSQNIPTLRGHIRASIQKRFSRISGLNYVPKGEYKFPAQDTKVQSTIRQFFHSLFVRGHGGAFAEGVRYNFITTNYDYILESILDPFDPEDSVHLYAYRGFTPNRINGIRNPEPLHDHWLVHHLIKLNGGFEILANDSGGFDLDFRKRSTSEVIERPPIVMLPSREQDYTNPYFAAVFPKAVRLMRETRVLVIVGYSLPPEDALIRFILRQFAEEREDAAGKVIFYINRSDNTARLEEIFPSISDLSVPRVFVYEGGFSDFTSDCEKAWSPRRLKVDKKLRRALRAR